MASESSVFGLSLLAVVVGLAILLYGAYVGVDLITYGGGVVVLAGIGLMTLYLSRLEGPTAAEH